MLLSHYCETFSISVVIYFTSTLAFFQSANHIFPICKSHFSNTIKYLKQKHQKMYKICIVYCMHISSDIWVDYITSFRGIGLQYIQFSCYDSIFILSLQKARCAYVLLLMSVFWLSEALPIGITALIPVFLFPTLGLMPAKQVCSMYSMVSINT